MKKFTKDVTISLKKSFLDMKLKGTKIYTEKVKARNPMYLHELNHYTTKILGDSATFEETIAIQQ